MMETETDLKKLTKEKLIEIIQSYQEELSVKEDCTDLLRLETVR